MAKITQGRASDACRYLDEDTVYRMGMRRILQGMILMKEAKTIVMLGTGQGKTLTCVSLAASKIRGKVYAIDLEHRGQRPIVRTVTKDENIEWIWESPDDVGGSLIPEPVDMLVIDDMLFSGDFGRVERISKLVKEWTKQMAADGIIVIRSKILSPFEVDKLPTAKVESEKDEGKLPEWDSVHGGPPPMAAEAEAEEMISKLPVTPHEDIADGDVPEDTVEGEMETASVVDNSAVYSPQEEKDDPMELPTTLPEDVTGGDVLDAATERADDKEEEISLSPRELDKIAIDKERSPENGTKASSEDPWANRVKIRRATRRKLGKKTGRKKKAK